MASHTGALDLLFIDKAPLPFFLLLAPAPLDQKGKEINRFVTASFLADPNRISVGLSVLQCCDSELFNLAVKHVLGKFSDRKVY